MAQQRGSFLKQILKTNALDIIRKKTKRIPVLSEGMGEGPAQFPDTDKFRTGLFQIYKEEFKAIQHEPITLLEIGICLGGSMFLWADFFNHKDTQIIGIDLRIPEVFFPPNVVTYVCDQNDTQRLRDVAKRHGPFDIIIDDGSHFSRETKNSFDILFPHVKVGGYYAIEDWAVGYWKDKAEGYKGMVDVVTDIIRRVPSLSISAFKVSLSPHHAFSLFQKGETGWNGG